MTSNTKNSYTTIKYLAQERTQNVTVPGGSRSTSLAGVKDADFVAIGLGGTNMLAMLWAIAMGRRAVGVELRGDPFLGVHWNIREDMYHQLGLIDKMMLDRYGIENAPKRLDGSLLGLSDLFYSPSTMARDIIPGAIIEGFDKQHHMVGEIHNIEYIDDRWKDGKPHRTVTSVPAPTIPTAPDPSKIRTDMREVLDGPSTWQAAAYSIQLLLRRYLEQLEKIDLNAGRTPRCRLFTQHRVVQDGSGLVHLPCGRVQIRIEEVTEIHYHNELRRIRTPGSNFIDLGVPELFSIATGINCREAENLGFQQHDVEVDHGDGQGPKVAQADFIAGQFNILVNGRLRRRIASEFDQHGNETWVRQIAVGHENDPRVSWLIVEVPEHISLCPTQRGLVCPSTSKDSAEYFAAYQLLLYDYYISQASLILEISPDELRRVSMVYGPKPFSLVERIGTDARIATNGVVAGDSFGNGHFLHSAGAMCGMLGHAYRFLEYWQRRADDAHCAESSIRLLADRIKEDTEALLHVSAKEFSQAIPSNFGAERGSKVAAASGIAQDKRAKVGEKRGRRWDQAPLNPTDWRRVFLRNGRTWSAELPRIGERHPAVRMEMARL
ncbi:signal peptide protein [Curvularia clavata]|uniref:Signal peptide protein n=1 Tax=Curvularia clavata TaxID=95742 RepID=A0A9Q9DSA1_CURCL|nr:signal peptide protein [Curvularia clavata]